MRWGDSAEDDAAEPAEAFEVLPETQARTRLGFHTTRPAALRPCGSHLCWANPKRRG